MEIKEAIGVLGKEYSRQKEFKRICDGCVGNELIEAFEVVLIALSGDVIYGVKLSGDLFTMEEFRVMKEYKYAFKNSDEALKKVSELNMIGR